MQSFQFTKYKLSGISYRLRRLNQTQRVSTKTIQKSRIQQQIPLSAHGDGTFQLEGLAKLGLKKKESKFVQLIKPVFPFVKNWTLIDQIFTTLSMLLIIRSLYFLPIFGINRQNLPSNIRLTSPEQAMLAELFMAHDSIPLNFALLGISPIILSSFFIQIMINIPAFQFIPGPIQHILSQKRMGTLTTRDLESASFKIAMMAGFVMASNYALKLKPYSTGGWLFVVTTVAGMLMALAITRYCCNVIQYRGLGEGTGFLLLALTLSGFGKEVYSIIQSVVAGRIPVWKVSIVVLLYITIVSCCVIFHDVHLRLPLTDYGMKSVRKSTRADLPPWFSQYLRKEQEQQTSVSSAPFFPLSISQTAVTAVFLSSTLLTFVKNFMMKWNVGLYVMRNGPISILLFGLTAFCMSLFPIGSESAASTAEYLAGMEVGIKGVIPGDQTIANLKRHMFRTRLFGACFLFFIVISCLLLDFLCAGWIGTPIGALNLVLLVAVIASGYTKMEAHVQTIRVNNILQKEKDVVSLFRQTRP